jgi:hypothetical protein
MTANEPMTIDLTPHWPGMFRYAVALCRDGLEIGQGRDLVIEMLEFGARLEAARAKATEGREERHSDLGTIDLSHDMGERWLSDPFGEEGL